jgi:double-stranded uracil-DNA glycosylase
MESRPETTTYEPEIITTGLNAVFCGINPATSASLAGFNFSNPSNRFWNVLYLAGLTDVRLRPEEERRLLDYRCGITVVVRRPTRRADEVSREEFRRARPEFERRIRRYAPGALAFLGKRAFLGMTNAADVPWGRQPIEFAGTTTWVLPNPSGLNRSFTLDALVIAYSEFRVGIEVARTKRSDENVSRRPVAP